MSPYIGCDDIETQTESLYHLNTTEAPNDSYIGYMTRVVKYGGGGPYPIHGLLRAQLVIIILYFQLEANFGYIVILFNGFV